MSDADAALHTLFEANRLLREAGDRLAATAGQTHARRMVLQATEDGATVPDIARKLGLHRQGIQRITDELVAEGLGHYVDNPRHQRSKLFIVNVHGSATLSEIHRSHTQWVDGIESAATGIDWRTLNSQLDELVRVLRSQADLSAAPD